MEQPVTWRKIPAAAAILEVLWAWLVALETGLAHRGDPGAVIIAVAEALVSAAVAWVWLRQWGR
ncbi:MAG: hypothetical protein KAX24_02245 [Anaerolineae bacterium]|nr:hypothetical protein [Anaerolineae bacterium]